MHFFPSWQAALVLFQISASLCFDIHRLNFDEKKRAITPTASGQIGINPVTVVVSEGGKLVTYGPIIDQNTAYLTVSQSTTKVSFRMRASMISIRWVRPHTEAP